MSSQIKAYLLEYRKHLYFSLAFLINLISFILVNFSSKDQVTGVLQYNVVLGVEIFGSLKELNKIPVIGFFILLVNSILYLFLKRKQQFLAEIALVTSFLASFILLVALAFLLGIN